MRHGIESVQVGARSRRPPPAFPPFPFASTAGERDARSQGQELHDATDMALAIVEKSAKAIMYQRQRLVAAVMVVPALAFLPRTVYARPLYTVHPSSPTSRHAAQTRRARLPPLHLHVTAAQVRRHGAHIRLPSRNQQKLPQVRHVPAPGCAHQGLRRADTRNAERVHCHELSARNDHMPVPHDVEK